MCRKTEVGVWRVCVCVCVVCCVLSCVVAGFAGSEILINWRRSEGCSFSGANRPGSCCNRCARMRFRLVCWMRLFCEGLGRYTAKFVARGYDDIEDLREIQEWSCLPTFACALGQLRHVSL